MAERLAQRNANTDPGTGLANRRELMHSIDDMLDAKRPASCSCSTSTISSGSTTFTAIRRRPLLKAVAETLEKSAPKGACCARIGGDEFAMLFAATKAQRAEKVAPRRSSTASPTPVFVEGAQLQVSASIGLALHRSATTRRARCVRAMSRSTPRSATAGTVRLVRRGAGASSCPSASSSKRISAPGSRRATSCPSSSR